MNISADTLCFLAVAALFVLFILPRMMGSMGGYPQGNYPNGNYPNGNYPNNNGPLNGNDRPTYDSSDVESRGSIGRDRGRSGGIFGNILSRPSGRSGSSGGTGIFRTPSSSRGSFGSSSSSRSDSPNVQSRGSIGRDRD